MPNINNNQSSNTDDQAKTGDQNPVVSFPTVSVEDSLPPMPQSGEQVEQKDKDILNPSPSDSGSAAPSDIPMPSVVGTVSPTGKKYAGGKIIATILGLFLLVGGVGAGVFLTNQNQNISEKAGENGCNGYKDRSSCEGQCSPIKSDGNSYECSWHQANQSCGETSTKCGIIDGTGAPEERSCDGNGCRYLSNTGDVKNYICNGTGYEKVPCKNECIRSDIYTGNGGLQYYCGNTASTGRCDNNGCYCDSKPANGIPEACSESCIVNRYTCKTSEINGGPCGGTPDATGANITFSGDKCGMTQQIDINCGGTQDSATKVFPPCEEETPPPSPTAQCSSVKAYNSSWTLLTTANLNALKADDSVYFCVNGVTSSGSFDKARFTIQGTQRAETTLKRPGSNDFCDLYEIPAFTTTTTFNVSAQIHHVTLGWK